jgi:hypothetical protein
MVPLFKTKIAPGIFVRQPLCGFPFLCLRALRALRGEKPAPFFLG